MERRLAATERREGRLAYLRVVERLTPLHDDPRFPDLVRRIGIPDD